MVTFYGEGLRMRDMRERLPKPVLMWFYPNFKH